MFRGKASSIHRAWAVFRLTQNSVKEIKDKKIPKIIARRGQIVDLGGGAYLQVLFPDRDVLGLTSNDGSLVMKLIYGDTSFLVTGD